jgi:hypothetical protein
MGFARWAWRHSATRQLLTPAPMPKRHIATVGGRTHHLTWADRHSTYRIKCSCGWIDPKYRLTERAAINTGNDHIGGVVHPNAPCRNAVRLALAGLVGIVMSALSY